jgi:hypothetical protein
LWKSMLDVCVDVSVALLQECIRNRAGSNPFIPAALRSFRGWMQRRSPSRLERDGQDPCARFHGRVGGSLVGGGGADITAQRVRSWYRHRYRLLPVEARIAWKLAVVSVNDLNRIVS